MYNDAREISWGTGSDVQIGTKVEGSHLNFFEPQQDRLNIQFTTIWLI